MQTHNIASFELDLRVGQTLCTAQPMRMPKEIGFKMGRQGEKVMAHARSNSTIIHVQLQCVTVEYLHAPINSLYLHDKPYPLSLSL
jgi:hypothetical protein